MGKPRLIVFASGSKTGGGSGFENLVLSSRKGILDADIIAVVSNNADGGVKEKASRLGVTFVHFPGPWTAENYQKIVYAYKAEFVSLSGWLKLVAGLDPRKTFNIHPGPLPQFGGPGMFGHHVHEAVIKAYHETMHQEKRLMSAVSMHFVTEEYDKGPVFFAFPVIVLPSDTAETLAERVNVFEHKHQPRITNLVCQGRIYWDGKNPNSLHVPVNY